VSPGSTGLQSKAVLVYPAAMSDLTEQLGRTCYGIEIEPRYVDVILQRWSNLTGKQAELISCQ